MKTAFSTALVVLAITAASAAHAESGKDVIAVQIQRAHQAWLETRAPRLSQAGNPSSALIASPPGHRGVMMTAGDCKCPGDTTDKS